MIAFFKNFTLISVWIEFYWVVFLYNFNC